MPWAGGLPSCRSGRLVPSLHLSFHPTPVVPQNLRLAVVSAGLPRVLSPVLTDWAVGTNVDSNSSRGRVMARSSWERAREDMA